MENGNQSRIGKLRNRQAGEDEIGQRPPQRGATRLLIGLEHCTAGFDEQIVRGGGVGEVGEFCCGSGGIELLVEFSAPFLHIFEGYLGAFDGQEFVAVGADVDEDGVLFQQVDAGKEQADEVHNLLPVDIAGAEALGLDFAELAEDVAVVGVVGQFGEELIAHGEQFEGDGAGVFNQRREEAFENGGVGFEGELEELLQFPVGFFGVEVLDLFGDAGEGPMEVGGGQIDASAVGVAARVVEAVGAGADDAAVDDVREERIVFRHWGSLAGGGEIFVELWRVWRVRRGALKRMCREDAMGRRQTRRGNLKSGI
jgi:hypothetical protein